MSNNFTILSFCGGGIRGLASVTMLNLLYQQYPQIISGASMLAGTSTGGGIVAALTLGGQSPQDLITFFKTTEADFYQNPNTSPTTPAYSTTEFAAGMLKKYGTNTLSKIGQKVLFTSFNVGDTSTATAWGPILYHNFPKSPYLNTLVADAVVSTGAMPGMFGSYHGNVDGAFVNHDPTLAAIALAVNSGVSLSDIVVICFGTGFMQNSLGSATASWGAQQWQQGDPKNPYNVPPLLINGTASPILNISLTGTSTNLIPELAGLMLPGRYANLNPVLSSYIPENDSNPVDLAVLQAASVAIVGTPSFLTAQQLVKSYWPAS